MSADLSTWALPRLERLLPLDRDSLKQIIEYADTLPKDGAAEHFKNMLGETPQSLEFISSFNTRRRTAPTSAAPSTSKPTSRQPSPPGDGVPRSAPRQAKKKQNIHALPARQVENHGQTTGAYQKKDVLDYMAGGSKSRPVTASLSQQPEIKPQGIKVVDTAGQAGGLLAIPQAPSAAVSATASPSPSPARTPNTSRPSSPSRSHPSTPRSTAPSKKTTIKISGGKAMHGASTTLSDLDSAIRSLELQTNPTLSSSYDDEADTRARACTCMATLHPLLTAAPNCLSCGQIICLKQGLGPCVSCGTALLSREEIGSLLRVLKDERGRERQQVGNQAVKRAEVATKPRPFTGRDFLSSAAASATSSGLASAASSKPGSAVGSRTQSPTRDSTTGTGAGQAERSTVDAAREHRDKLLAFQSQNAKRTQIHDEAADFSLPVLSGDGAMRAAGGMWAGPEERALELKRQQKVMREMEFNARPEWERKREVASIDVVKGKVVKRFVQQKFEDEGNGEVVNGGGQSVAKGQRGVREGLSIGVQTMARPVEQISVGQKISGGGGQVVGSSGQASTSGGQTGAFGKNPLLGKLIRPVYKAEGQDGASQGEQRSRQKTWRRVQDDLDDNEDVILDGGIRGFAQGVGMEVR